MPMGSMVSLSPLSSWQGSTDILESHGYRLWDLPTAPSRMPAPGELEAAARAAGLDPADVCSGGLASVELDTEKGAVFDGCSVDDVVKIAVELAPVVGPLVVLDVTAMTPVVVSAQDRAEERLAWLIGRTAGGQGPTRHTVRVVSLAAFQWSQVLGSEGSWVFHLTPDERLGWIRRTGAVAEGPLPRTDLERDHSPHPSEVAALLRIDGRWSSDRSRWTADGEAHGLGKLSARLDRNTQASLGLEFNGARALPVAQLARRLAADCGPLVVSRDGGPQVLVVGDTDPAEAALLLEGPA